MCDQPAETGQVSCRDCLDFAVESVGAPLADERVDLLERRILAGELALVDQPVTHRFTPGLYIREILNPAGSIVTTKVHKTEHPFFVLRGRALVRPVGAEAREVAAGHVGVTEPGTRRIIYAITDVVWVTVHAITPGEEAEPDLGRRLAMIEARLIERRELDDGKTAHELFLERYEEQGRLAP